MRIPSLRSACGLAVLAVSVVAMPARAEVPGASAPIPTDLYISPQNSGIAIPSGNINLVPAEKQTSSTAPADAPTGDVTNLLGCGGVGQGEYTSALYNMPESFAKFQTDVDSLLSKQILTMNYIMPQTAALFDQLNNYGNQRYEIFQKGCRVDPLKEDARTQYIRACVAKIQPERKAIILTGGNPSGPHNSTGSYPAQNMSPEMIDAMAYAQSWEICSNQSISDTTALATRKETLDAFARQTRKAEDVMQAIAPILCQVSATAPTEKSFCWPARLLPKVRLCHDATLEGGCTGGGAYGITEPAISMPRFFDTLRFIMDDTVVARRVSGFNQQITQLGVPAPMQKLAASEAALSLSTATLNRSSSGDSSGTLLDGGHTPQHPELGVKDFQFSYLNCKQADIMNPLKQYAYNINQRLKSGSSTASTEIEVKPELTVQSLDPILENLQLGTSEDKEKETLRDLLWVSLGCTANQSIPIFDPNITASLNTQCVAQDKYAFYTMAGYDVALTATRDVYRYMNQRLKQAYTRLMTDAMVPVSSTTATDTSPTLSPELNSRLARAVKETLIPYVDDQLARLDSLTQTRGEFAQRVQQIYTAKNGCVYTGVLPGGKPLGKGGRLPGRV